MIQWQYEILTVREDWIRDFWDHSYHSYLSSLKSILKSYRCKLYWKLLIKLLKKYLRTPYNYINTLSVTTLLERHNILLTDTGVCRGLPIIYTHNIISQWGQNIFCRYNIASRHINNCPFIVHWIFLWTCKIAESTTNI